MDNRADKLSDDQRVCLRMVMRHLSSKEIAQQLKISHYTVDQRISLATRKLGVSTRFEAARLLAKIEGPPESLVYEPPYIAPSPPPNDMLSASNQANALQTDDGTGSRLREPRAAFGELPLASFPSPVLQATAEGKRNDLTSWQRLGLMTALAIGSALAFGAVLAGLQALATLA